MHAIVIVIYTGGEWGSEGRAQGPQLRSPRAGAANRSAPSGPRAEVLHAPAVLLPGELGGYGLTKWWVPGSLCQPPHPQLCSAQIILRALATMLGLRHDLVLSPLPKILTGPQVLSVA